LEESRLLKEQKFYISEEKNLLMQLLENIGKMIIYSRPLAAMKNLWKLLREN